MGKLKPLTSTEHQRARDHSLETLHHADNGHSAGFRLISRAELEQMHVLVCQALDHQRNKNIELRNLIRPRPGEKLPQPAPLKEPDPPDPRTLAAVEAMAAGMTMDQAVASVDRKGRP